MEAYEALFFSFLPPFFPPSLSSCHQRKLAWTPQLGGLLRR